MVLCAGLGTRLEKHTKDRPKALLDIGGRPVLEHILANLRRYDFTEVMVNLHYKGMLIRRYFDRGDRFQVKLSYSQEEELLGTAGSVRRVADFLVRSDPLLVHYGDVVTDQDLGEMVAFHRERAAEVTMLVHRRTKVRSVVEVGEGGLVTGFREVGDKPEDAEESWVFSGLCLCSCKVVAAIPEKVPCDFPRDVFPGLVAKGSVFAFPLTGRRVAVDSGERLEEARRVFGGDG